MGEISSDGIVRHRPGDLLTKFSSPMNALRLSQCADDLLSREEFSAHFDLSSSTDPNLKVGSVFGGQVTSIIAMEAEQDLHGRPNEFRLKSGCATFYY